MTPIDIIRTRRARRALPLALVGFALVGCSTASTAYRAESSFDAPPSQAYYGGESAPAGYDEDMESVGAATGYDPAPEASSAAASRTRNAPAAQPMRVAVNSAPPSTTTSTGPTLPPQNVVTDASATRALIVYTASVVLAIYEVDQTQRQVVAAAEQLGGFVASLDERTVVVRVPAASFQAFLDSVEATGRVLGRSIRADDITEQFRDLEIRMQNLVAMRARLEAMLAHASTVAEALSVERELERITAELESMRGRLRFLSDRVAFSTVTIEFRALPREQLASDTPTAPPIPWLRSLGLGNLLQN